MVSTSLGQTDAMFFVLWSLSRVRPKDLQLCLISGGVWKASADVKTWNFLAFLGSDHVIRGFFYGKKGWMKKGFKKKYWRDFEF